MMFWRRRNATHSLHTQNFRASLILAMLILLLSILHVSHSTEIRNYKNSPSVGPSLRAFQGSQHSVRSTIEDDAEESLDIRSIIDRLNAAAALRTNMLTSIGRILLLSLDENSRIAFEEIHDAFRSRHVPSYDYLALVPGMRGTMPKQQLRSVLQLMESISTPYISSYATMCLEALSSGKVNVEVTTPTDLLLGIDNSTQNSLAMDEHRKAKVPSTFEEAVSILMNSVAGELIAPDLELVAALMVNLPNFDVTNPEVPESLKYVAKYMRDNSKSGDPVLEYLNVEQTSGADKLVKEVLERILVSKPASSVLREAVGQLLKNFRDLGNEVRFRTWNTTELFNVVSPDFYPRSVVAIAEYFQQNVNLLYDIEADLTLYPTELHALAAVVRKIAKNSSLPEQVRESAAVLASFVAQKAREENPQYSIEEVNVQRALEYLDAFQSPCVPEKLSRAAKTLRPYLDDTLPWSYAFGDTRLRGSPHKLLVNAMIRLRNIDVPQELRRALDDFVYQTQSSGVTGKRSIIYDDKVIFQRGDTDLVELDFYSLVERLPGVFRDERFTPLLVFVSKENLPDYLGRGFNMFAHTEPGSLFIELIKTAIDKQAVREDEALFRSLIVSEALLEEPTLVNKYSSERLNDVIKALPAIDDDPRYLPIKLLFKKDNLFNYIPLNFSLAGLESPLQHVALVLNTVRLKPIDERLEESIACALTNLEGPQLPARSFTREDFTYLVSHLLARQKKVAGVILKSKIYNPVSQWNIMVSGSPEEVLARTLSYPVKELSKNRKLHDVVKVAVKFLGDDTPPKVDLLDKKILDLMLNYVPDMPDLRPVIIILKHSNLATLLEPRLNISYLSEQPPREALIVVLQNLMASSRLKKETVLSKRVNMTLKHVEESVDPPDHDVPSIVTEELLDPMAQKYEPLRETFKVVNRNSSLKDSKIAFRDFLSGLKIEKKNPQLSKAANLALQEIDSDHSTQGIEDSEILEALSLLPDEPTVTPLNRLLTTSWIRDILPNDFESADYSSSEKILKIILFETKERPEVLKNPGLVNAISVAEKSLVSRKRDVEPLKKVVYAVTDALYDPIEELLKPKSLHKLNLTFDFDSEKTPKQLMIDLLQKLMEKHEIKANSQLMHVLDGLQRDLLDFGLDVDLLCALDDAGIPYRPSLAPVRIFLYTRMPTSELVRSVTRVSSAKKRFKIIKHSLSTDKLVQADEELLNSVHELARIKPTFDNPLGATMADMMDIVDALPDEVVRKYPEIKKLLRPKILKQLPFRSGILESGEPVKIFLTELSNLPKVSKSKKLSAKVAQFSEELGNLVNLPVISGYNLRPLLREFKHVRQINVDYIVKIIDPKMLSVLLPDGLDDFDETQDDAELLNNILDEVLSQNVSKVDAVLLKHVSSMQRDLVTVLTQRRKKNGKQLLSDQDVNKMMMLIPKAAEFEAIRNFIKAKNGFDAMPQSIGSSKYSMPSKRLIKILDIVQRSSGTQKYLRDSVIGLKSHLTRQYLFVNESDVEILMDAINGLSVDHDLVPLRLFLTVENLVKYLPSCIELGRFESSRQALKAVLHILRDNKKLENNIMLQQSIAVAVAALREDGSDKKVAGRNVERTTLEELTIYDLRFLLNLELNSELKDYLSPENLIKILPRDFSFASKTTFKSKVLHVLDYLAGFELGPREEIQRMILTIEMLEDLPVIDSEALERLVAVIDRRIVGKNFDVIKKYLTVHELVKIVPGFYRLRNDADVREALIELSVMVLWSLRESQKREIAAIEIFLIQLRNPWSPLLRTRAKVAVPLLESLIAEIPFKTCKNIRNLDRNLKPDRVLEMFPVDFDPAMYRTRKLKLLAILNVVENHPNASKFNESVRVAKKCVEKMQDAPKLSNWNIGEILNATYIDQWDVTTLLKNCKAVDLAEHLPITFDYRKIKSTRDKLMVLIKYCQKLKHDDPAVFEALKKAKTYADKLPSADLDRIGLNIILNEICCCNFTSIKPLKVFIGTNDLLPLLPPTLNLEKEPTFKHKVLALLGVLQNMKEFQSKEMIKSLNTAKETARALPDVALISEKDIEELKHLDAMMLPEAEPFAKTFVLHNLIKVLPPSFNINNFISAEGKLTRLMDYALQIPEVKIDKKCAEAWNIVYKTLRNQAEKEILDFIEIYTRQDYALTQLLIYMLDHKDQFFDQIWITHSYEYELIEDRVRVVLRYMLRFKTITHFKCLTKSINLMISRYLSEGRRPTEYEVLHAIDHLPDSDQNRDLKILLSCKDVKYRAKSTLTLTPEHSVRAILLDMLTMLKSTTVDKETKAAIDIVIPDVEQAIRDDDVKELLKQVPNSEDQTENFRAVRSYYVLKGPTVIFGANYHSSSFDHRENLHKLVNTLLISPDVDKDKGLKTEVEYLKEVLRGPRNDTSPQWQTTMQDIDITLMLSVLPKIKSDELIFGLLKFFTDPKLTEMIGPGIDPAKFGSQGALMQKIVDVGLTLDSVKRDPKQLRALKYVRDKILLIGVGALPIKLKRLSRYATVNPDPLCLFEAVDCRSANLSNVVPIAKFFETKYDPLIHGRGFDHTAHHTRGAYLKALLDHLIANGDLQGDIERQAKVVMSFVKLDGSGAEPIDLNEDIAVTNRVLDTEFSPGPKPRATQSPDVSAHFRNHPQDPWKKVFTVEPARRSISEQSYLQSLMEKEGESPNLFEEERSSLRNSIKRMLHPNGQTREASVVDPDKSVSPEDDISSVSEKQIERSKREVRQDELPAETDSEYEAIPHTVSKNLGTIDFVSRKLFIRDDTDPSLIRKPRDLPYDISIENRKSVDRTGYRLVKKHWSLLPHARSELDMILNEICCCGTGVKPFIVFKATHNVLALLPQTLDLDKEPTFKHKLLAVLATLRNLKEFQSEEMMIALDTAEEEAYAMRDTAMISDDDVEELKQLDVMMAPEAEPFVEIFVLDNLIKVLPPSFDIDDDEIEETKLARLIDYSMYLVEVKTDDKYADAWRFVYRTLLTQAENEILDFIEIYGRIDENLTSLVVYMQDHREDFFKNVWAMHGFEYWLVDDRVRVVLKYMLQLKRITYFKHLTQSIESLISMLSHGPPTRYEILQAINRLPDSDENRQLKIRLRCKDIIDQAKKSLVLTPEHDYDRILFDLSIMFYSRTKNGKTNKRYTREAPIGSPEELVIPSVSQGPIEFSKREVRDDASAVSRLDGEEPLDPETATFSPDKVLVDVETRLVKGPLKTEHDDGSYITEEEAAELGRRKHDPVRPLTVPSQDGLPAEMDSEYEAIPHTESKNPGQIDLVSRKLFIRNDTDPSLIRNPRDLSEETLIEDHGNVDHENKTVKKDLSQSPSARCYAKPEIILEYELPDDVSEDLDSVPVPEALTLQRSTDLPDTERPEPMIDDGTRVSEDRKLIGHLTDDMAVEDFKAHVMETPKSPKVRVLAKHETSKDDEKRNTDHIEGASSLDEVKNPVQVTEDGEETFPQKVFLDYYYEEAPVVLEGQVGQDLIDYANVQDSFIRIDDIFLDSTRSKRSSDNGIPVIEAVGENVNYATSPVIHDVAHLSKKDVKRQDDSHLKWEGHYMAGRKR